MPAVPEREIELQVAARSEQGAGESPGLEEADDLTSWLELIVDGMIFEGTAPRVDSWTVRLVDDEEMRALSHRFRQLDKTTDVLTFPGDLAGDSVPGDSVPDDSFLDDAVPTDGAAAPAGGTGWPALPASADLPRHLGDVVISLPTARRQAEVAGHSLNRELKTLALHGLLHCLGFDHETDDGTMERRELELRDRYLSASPVQDRA